MCTQPVAVKTSSRRTAPGRRGVEARWVHVGFPPSGGRGSVDELTNAAVHELVDQARCCGRVAGALDSSSGRGRRAVRPQPVREAWSTGAEVAGAPVAAPSAPPRELGGVELQHEFRRGGVSGGERRVELADGAS